MKHEGLDSWWCHCRELALCAKGQLVVIGIHRTAYGALLG